MSGSNAAVFAFLVLSLATASAIDSSLVHGSGHTVGYGELEEEWRGEIVHLSWSPRAFLIKSFLSDAECKHLINVATPTLSKSVVVDVKTGKNVESDIRTSSGTFLDLCQDDLICKLEKRVAQISMIPQENQEGFQVLHYKLGQKYEPHHDSFSDKFNAMVEKGGQRVATLLMYLKGVEDGGETVFPQAADKVVGEGWSACAKKGMAVRPQRGDAVLFYSLKPDGTEDSASLHGSCPVLKGDKWTATKWIRTHKRP